MSDIEMEQAPEVEVEEGEAPEVQFDAEAERERIREEVKAENARREKELQKGFQEIAERERRLAQPVVPEPERPELDPEAAAAVKNLIETEYAPLLQQSTMAMNSMADEKLKSFAHDKGVDPEELRDTIAEFSLVTKPGLEGVDDAITKAYAIHQSKTFDPEAERQRIREELIAEAEGGVRVEGITPKKGKEGPASSGDVHEMTTKERLAYYKETYPDIYPD